jgi:hypothetical protein
MQPPADGNSEFFCMHEPDVPLLNRVLERKAPPTILPGHSDGQPQVVLEELPAGLTVAGLGPGAKVCLLRVAEQTSPAAVQSPLYFVGYVTAYPRHSANAPSALATLSPTPTARRRTSIALRGTTPPRSSCLAPDNQNARYSPECVEGAFSELSPNGVLGSRASEDPQRQVDGKRSAQQPDCHDDHGSHPADGSRPRPPRGPSRDTPRTRPRGSSSPQ